MVAPTFRVEVPLRAVTGRTSRRFSLPALPTQQLCLELDPHDARPTRNPADLPLEQKRSVKTMGETAARWKAGAAQLPRENSAHMEAMRLQQASQEQTPSPAVAQRYSRTSRHDVRMAAKGVLRTETRPRPPFSQCQPPLSSSSSLTKGGRSVKFALKIRAEESRAVDDGPKTISAPARLKEVAPPEATKAEESHARRPPRRSPALPVTKSRSPASRLSTEVLKATPGAPATTMVGSQESVQEVVNEDNVAVQTKVRADSTLSVEEQKRIADAQEAALPAEIVQDLAQSEEPQESADDAEIKASYSEIMPFLARDDVDRGRRLSRGNR